MNILSRALPIDEDFKTSLFSSVVPVMGFETGSVCQWGTGTFFAVADVRFLITAAHVISDAEKKGVPLHISDDAKPAPAVNIAGCKTYRLGSPHDIAIIELTPEIVAEIPNRTFVRLTDVEFLLRPTCGEFLVWGFPRFFSVPATKHLLRPKAMGWLTLESEPRSNLENFDPTLHFLFPVPDEQTSSSSNEPAPPPGELRGISGCGVWRVNPDRDGSFNVRSVPHGRLVAIQTCVYESKKLARATLWAFVARALWEKYENLRPALRMHIPAGFLRFVTGD